MAPSEIDKLESCIKVLLVLVHVATAAVVVGLYLEYEGKLRPLSQQFRTALAARSRRLLKGAWTLFKKEFGPILVIGGVALEFCFGSCALRKELQLNKIHKKIESDQADKVANLYMQVEKLRNENLGLQIELENIKRPRRLSEKQIKAIQDSLAKFPQTELILCQSDNGDEVTKYTKDIREAIKGWKIAIWELDCDLRYKSLKIIIHNPELETPSLKNFINTVRANNIAIEAISLPRRSIRYPPMPILFVGPKE
ncbi:MAG: hypothetical protein HY078_04370 [Elusimicrobia bacterium]|nr:hypothetical protein [Elusimicrobiota bacterium]